MKKAILPIIVFFVVISLYALNSKAFFVPIMGSSPTGCAGGSDGAIGSSDDSNGTQTQSQDGDNVFYSNYTPTEDGTVTYLHVYFYYLATGSYANAGIWDNSGNHLVDATPIEGTNAGQQQANFVLDSAYCLETGVTYRLGWVSDGNDTSVGHYYDGAGDVWEAVCTYGTDLGDMSGTPQDKGTYLMTIWADNSAS